MQLLSCSRSALDALVSLYGLIADPVTINEHLNGLRGYLSAAVLDLVGQELARLEQTRSDAHGFTLGGLVFFILVLKRRHRGP